MQLRKSRFFLFARGSQLDNGVTSPCQLVIWISEKISLWGTTRDFISQWQLLGQLDLLSYMFTGEFPVVQPKNYFCPYMLVYYYLDITNNNLNNSASLLLSDL